MAPSSVPVHVVTITEVLERSTQGRTRPFLCRADDNELYYVKGVYAGMRSHLCEWMAGHLALALELPIPPFRLANVPAELIALLPDGSEIGTRTVFASRLVPNLSELSYLAVSDVNGALRRDVLVFDWWTRNGDRTLTQHGGNPNLLWDPVEKRLVAIDNNLAFDDDFSKADYQELHIFKDDIPSVFNDLAECGMYAKRLIEALQCWEPALATVPDEWWFQDDHHTVPTTFDPVSYRDMLSKCNEEEFWRLA